MKYPKPRDEILARVRFIKKKDEVLKMKYPKPRDEIKDLESALSWIDELEGVIDHLEDTVVSLRDELDLKKLGYLNET